VTHLSAPPNDRQKAEFMRKCFIHIGTHRTGTTSIQATLSGRASDLAQHGFLYPKAGIPKVGIPPEKSGHHNIAWELSADHRFRSEDGTIDDLLKEIDESEQDIIISSEDFECAAWRPARFQILTNGLKRRALEVAVVAYLRNQADYAQSLYLTLLQFGYDGTFVDFISSLLDHRAIRWKDWVFGFCYRDLLGQFPPETRIIARSYDQAGSVVADFLKLLGLTPSDFNICSELHANQQPPIGAAFSTFYRNRTGRTLDRPGSWVMPMMARVFDGANMEDQTKERLIASYHQSNCDVESRYGISGLVDITSKESGSVAESTSPAESNIHPCLEDIFSVAMTRLIDEADQAPAEQQSAFLPEINKAALATAYRRGSTQTEANRSRS
jgi:hypothetical protein